MALKNYSLNKLVPLTAHSTSIAWEEIFGRSAPLYVEIGFGCGEVLIREAQKNQAVHYIGIEQHWERIYKTLRRMTRLETGEGAESVLFDNIRILKADARVVLERFFMPYSIEHVYSIFPCPWPKKGHVKHRLFSRSFLRLLNSRLKRRGTVQIVTDYEPYLEWILGQLNRTGLASETKVISPRFQTKFERKWQAEGQEKFFEITLTKKRHIPVPLQEGVPLKAYRLQNFNPENFSFVNQTGSISVIFKDMLYDDKRQRAMIHLIVSEDQLTQHFWVAIKKVKDFWRVCKADGQTFFPTTGIAQAVHRVYEAAKSTV